MTPWFSRLWRIALLSLGLPLPSSFAASPEPAPRGSLVIIGGALRPQTAVVWSRIVSLAGGQGAKIAVLPTAAAEPQAAGEGIAARLQAHGAAAFVLPLAPKLASPDYREVARDPAWVKRLDEAGGVYFGGGEQARITSALHDEAGRPTPVLEAIWRLYRRGGVIAGTSAGAAIMSRSMFSEPADTLTLLRRGVREGKDVAPGLGFIGKDIFVDQHCLARGRFARMLVAMLAGNYRLGLGIDEDTAAVVEPGGAIEIIGSSGAVLLDLDQARREGTGPALRLREARVSVLGPGDRFEPSRRRFVPAQPQGGLTLDPAAPGFRPEHGDALWSSEILGRNVLPEVLARLIASGKTEALGLAFDLAAGPGPQTGFEFRFRKTPGSIGYRAGQYSAELYSVFGVGLDVVPVSMALPFYRVDQGNAD